MSDQESATAGEVKQYRFTGPCPHLFQGSRDVTRHRVQFGKAHRGRRGKSSSFAGKPTHRTRKDILESPRTMRL